MFRTMRLQLAVLAVGLSVCLPSAARADVAFSGNLSAAQQQQIANAHAEALRIVDNALAFLRGNAAYSIQGQNPTYNTLTQFFDRSAANPLRGNTAYQNAISTSYFQVRQDPVGFGTVVSAQSNVNAFTAGTFTFNPNPLDDGTVQIPGFVYVTPRNSLYVPDDANPIPLPLFTNPSFGPFAISAITRRTVTTGSGTTTSTQQELVSVRFSIPPFTAGPIVPGVIYPNTDAALRPVIGATNSLDAERYTRLITLMQSVRDALAFDTTTYRNDLEANRVAIINLLNSRNLLDNQYGFSTSNSTLNNARDLAMLTNPALNPLLWTEDTGARVGGLLSGALLAGEKNTFFDEKFTTLLNNAGTLFIGQSALAGVQARNDGLFDSTNQGNNKETTEPLAQLILEAFISNLSGGDSTFGRNEINAANGSPNGDITGMPNPEFFSSDRDVQNLASFLAGLLSASTAPPAGNDATSLVPRGSHVALAGQGFQADFGNFIIVPPP